MESVWFYVLCFYIWKMFGKLMLMPSITRGYFQLYRRNTLYRKKLDSKNDRKKFGAFIKPRCQKQKKSRCSSTYSLRYQYSPMSNSSSKVILRFGNIVKDMSC